MAPPSHQLPPASASFTQSGPASVNVEDLKEDIILQEIILESLTGTVEDTPERRAEVKAEIRDLKQKLAASQQPSQMPSVNPFRHNNVSHPQSGRSTPSAMSEQSGNVWGNLREDAPSASRKRTFSTHNGAVSQVGPSKSRRTTPSPMMNPHSSPSDDPYMDGDYLQPIDLTRDDWVSNQRAGFESISEKRRREEEDAAAARRLYDELNNLSSTSSFLPSSSGPTAFDRIKQSSQGGPTVDGFGRDVNAESSSTPHRLAGSPSSHRMGSSSRIPSHVKSESPTPSRLKELPATKSSGPSKVLYRSIGDGNRMPGSFVSDSEDSDDPVLQPQMGTGPAERNGFPRSFHAGNHPSFLSGSSLLGDKDTPGIPGYASGEFTREAAFRRLGGGPASGFNSNPFGARPPQSFVSSPSSSSSSPAGPSAAYQPWNNFPGARPGSLLNGSANPLDLDSLDDSPLVYPNRFGQPTSGDLGDVINRTAGYDYTNGTDRFGNPLPEHVRNYVDDFVGDTRNNDHQIRELLANIRPDMEIPEEDRDQTPDALKYPLYKHQKIALAWMTRMEQDGKKKGGILADDMGLGKTISSLALMVSRKAPRPDPGKRLVKTNLIIGPVALIRQWEREIQTKVRRPDALSVFLLHGKKTNYDHLRTFDVVLTTYGTLASDHKRMENYIKEQTKEGRIIDNAYLSLLCPLIGPHCLFYRVILDEAQFIKNSSTLSAKAAYNLKAEYRWCLSGTPMMNDVLELASLLRFLRIEPYCQVERFRRDFGCLSAKRTGGNRPESMRRLQALLKAIMLRRSKTSQIDGKPIIELKEKVEEVVHVVFSADEEQYYRDLEKNSRVQFSKYLKSGTVGKHYASVLVLLLRLRQACCHPYLHITDLEFANGEISEDEMVTLAKTLAPEVVRRIKEADGFECPICMDAVENPSIMLPCGHDVCSGCFVRLTEGAAQSNMQAGQETGTMHCPECRGNVDVKKVINYDVFKQVHMPETVKDEVPIKDDETASDTDSETTSDSDDDLESGEDVDKKGNLKDFVVDDDDEASDEDAEAAGRSSDLEDIGQVIKRAAKASKKNKGKAKKRKSKSKGKKKDEEVQPHMLKQLRKAGSNNRQAHKRYMKYLKNIWLPSAKVNKCRDLISEIQKTGEKTIVFSQWTILLDLLEIPIQHELNLDYRRYDGGMSAVQRDIAARDFMEKPDVKVIFISLKAGNAGLNLTAASQIIIMDPFWNPYTEMQAVDRAHRIGQQKTVKVHRILIQETVEDRIIALQEKKRELVDSALDEGAAKNLGRLGANELAYLFGIGDGR